MQDGAQTSKDPTIAPALGEVFRTCIHPASLCLLVVDIAYYDAKHDQTEDQPQQSQADRSHRHAVRLLLTDGELMIQALLNRKLAISPEARDTEAGDTLDIRKFVVKKSRKLSGRGSTLYLGIDDCYFIQQKKESTAAPAEAHLEKPSTHRPQLVPRPPSRNMQFAEAKTNSLVEDWMAHLPPAQEIAIANDTLQDGKDHGNNLSLPQDQIQDMPSLGLSQTDSADDFETFEVDEGQISKRRRVLKELDGNVRTPVFSQELSNQSKQTPKSILETSAASLSPFHPPPQVPIHAFALSQCHPLQDGQQSLSANNQALSAAPLQQIRGTAHATPNIPPPQPPPSLPQPPMHTLASLRNPPASRPLPSKNYILTTLAYITWTGQTLIHRAGSAFPPKRHLKLLDPSLEPTVSSTTNAVSAQLDLPLSSVQTESAQRIPPPNPRIAVNPTPSFQPQTSFQTPITLAIYADAASFKPSPGTLALFRGVVMQRLQNGDVILNAYQKIRDNRYREPAGTAVRGGEGDKVEGMGKGHEHWFITDVEHIRALGFGEQVDTYQAWWQARTGRNDGA